MYDAPPQIANSTHHQSLPLHKHNADASPAGVADWQFSIYWRVDFFAAILLDTGVCALELYHQLDFGRKQYTAGKAVASAAG